MKYTWDLEKLRYRKKLLEEIARHTDDENTKYNALEQVDIYSDMMKTAKKKSNSMDELDSTLNDLTFDQLVDEVMASYSPRNLKYIDLLLQSFFKIKDYNSKKEDDTTLVSTNDELVDLALDFFDKKTPSYVKKEFINILNQKDIINISYTKSDTIYAGYTLYDYFLNKKYIFVGRSNKLYDLGILPHEAFHYIFRDKNVGLVGLYDTYYLTEVEGMFANILFGEYFKENTSPSNTYFEDYSLSLFKNNISDLVTRNTVLDSLKTNKKIRLSKLNKYLGYFEVLPFITQDELIPYLTMPEEDVIKYALSYLTALDLYYIYKKDPEEAFYLLSCITYMKQTNEIIILLKNNDITFMKDDFKNLKKYVKNRNN